MKQRITEEKLKDKRFRETEKAILIAFFSMKEKIDTNGLIKKAHISRSTFNRHHKNVYEIVPDYEMYIMRKFKLNMGKLINKEKVEIEKVYRRMLLFILKNRTILGILIKNEEKEIIEKMVEAVEPKIVRMKGDFRQEILKVHAKEIIGLIEIWGTRGFKREELERIYDKIMFLTDSIKIRLEPIWRKDR